MRAKKALVLAGLVAAAVAAVFLGARLFKPEDLAAGDALAERRARIESLSPAAKEDLLEHWKRFTSLPAAEQDRIRRLHARLEEQEHGAELRRVMFRYYDWLKSLPLYQQAELRDLAPAERVKQIHKLMEQQAQRGSKVPPLGEAFRDYRLGKGPLQGGGKRAWLSPQDVEALLQWFDQYVNRHGEQFLETLPEPQRQNLVRGMKQAKDPIRRQEILMAMWLRWQIDNPAKLPAPNEQELADLRSRLSLETCQRLAARPAAEQWRVLASLIPLFVLQQYAARRTDEALPALSEEELAEFFEKELTASQRDRLLNLPGDEMTRELWRLYVRWKVTKVPRAAADHAPKERRNRPGKVNPRQTSPAADSGGRAKSADKR